jgi:hypothetical protein
MLNLKRLGASLFLTCALGLTAFADCPVPGAIGTPEQIDPPCTSAQAVNDSNESTAPGIIDGPPAASVSAEVDSLSFAEFALNMLTLF